MTGPGEGTDWLVTGLEDDVRPRMFAAAERDETFALATIVSADGGPRPVGAQMVVTRTESWGFLSGGCIEDDVALHSREVIASGIPQTLVYGDGSPFIDIQLPCGGRIEVVIERVLPDDPALHQLHTLTRARHPALWTSDGTRRDCGPPPEKSEPARRLIWRHYTPAQRLLVVGSDPFALAIAMTGKSVGWETVLLSPFGPSAKPPSGLNCDRRPIERSLAETALDQWTAVAVATHDLERDEDALVPALRSAAGYVGVLGSRRKLEQRLARLKAAGIDAMALARLRAPIGLDISAASPWEVALATVAEIVDTRRKGEMERSQSIAGEVHAAA